MTANIQLRGDKSNPHHLSIGAVLVENNEITLIKKEGGSFTLPSETVYINESIEDALIRGAQEEIGIIVREEKYLGSQITFFRRPDNTKVEKTTLYFLVTKQKEATKKQEPDELKDEVITLNVQKAIELLKKQCNEEYKILEKLI